jgi:hypothetical protein
MFFFVPFNFWILILMMFAKTACPATTSASSGESPAERSGPQPAPSTSVGGRNIGSATVPAHAGGGPSQILGGRSCTLGGGGPTSRDGQRVSRSGYIGSHGGGPFCGAGCGGGCGDSRGSRGRGR